MTTAIPMLKRVALLGSLISICGFGPFPAPATNAAIDADIIVTVSPVYEPLAALAGKERFPAGAHLMLLRAGKAEPLLPEFAASADANVSFDGERVLFAGKPSATDPWQIWELSLNDHSTRKLIAGETDAIRPFYLPSGRFVYAQRTASGFQLEAAGKDAASALASIDAQARASVLPLSYLQGNAIPADVLLDGRILFESNFPLGTGSMPEMFLVYSDGSGVESYRCDHGTARWGGAQLASGDVVFTHGDSLARFTSPLAHEAPIVAPRAQYAGAIAETASGAWLLGARKGASDHYALTLWKPGTSLKGSAQGLKILLAVSGQDVVEPQVATPRTRPKRHPSGLHDWTYANMMALDSRLSRAGDLKIAPAAVRLEAMDADGRVEVMGTAPVEADGSFFVKTSADRPIRFALLDSAGSTVREEHGWFWMRRGEQRYCVGCHTGPERSSENRLPLVLSHTTTPVDLTGQKPTSQSPGTRGGN
jgi:hypothetical protein